MKNLLSTNTCFLISQIKKLLAKWKGKGPSEGKINDEFVWLKSKMYSVKNIGSRESNTAKGANIATELKEFKNTLFNKKVVRHKMRRIQSNKYKNETYKVNKVSLSYFDDKGLVLDDGIHTPAYFHRELSK